MSFGGQLAILTQPTADPTQLRAALEAIAPADGHANFGELGRGIRTLAESARTPIDLHLFSDMQRTAMPANFADLGLPSNVTLLLHPVAKGPAPANWTVAQVDAPAELADPKDPRRSHVHAELAGFNTPAATKLVSLLVNGKVQVTRKVDIPANGRAAVDFAPLDVGYGFNRCEVRIEAADAFPADDTSVFAVRRADPERVLFLHPAGETRSTLYFGAALAAAAQGAFVLQSMPAEQATDLDPAKFAFVVLSDTVALPTLFERTLTQYVAAGGSVLIAPRPRCRPPRPHPAVGGRSPGDPRLRPGRRHPRLGRPGRLHPPRPPRHAQPNRDNGGWADSQDLLRRPGRRSKGPRRRPPR